MTEKTRSTLYKAAQIAALFIPALTGAWGFARWASGTKVDVTTYQLDRVRDSLNLKLELRDVQDSLHEMHSELTAIHVCLRTKGPCP